MLGESLSPFVRIAVGTSEMLQSVPGCQQSVIICRGTRKLTNKGYRANALVSVTTFTADVEPNGATMDLDLETASQWNASNYELGCKRGNLHRAS